MTKFTLRRTTIANGEREFGDHTRKGCSCVHTRHKHANVHKHDHDIQNAKEQRRDNNINIIDGDDGRDDGRRRRRQQRQQRIQRRRRQRQQHIYWGRTERSAGGIDKQETRRRLTPTMRRTMWTGCCRCRSKRASVGRFRSHSRCFRCVHMYRSLMMTTKSCDYLCAMPLCPYTQRTKTVRRLTRGTWNGWRVRMLNVL